MSSRMLFPDEPTPTLWSERSRSQTSSPLDSETAAALACYLDHTFSSAADWGSLLAALAERNFALEIQTERLVLVHAQTGVAICTCARLGHSFAALRARLGKPVALSPSGRLVPRRL